MAMPGNDVSDFSAFANLERSGWLDAMLGCRLCRELFASASDQAINKLIGCVCSMPPKI